MWMYALTGPFAGSICDRVSRKVIIVTALVFWSLTTGATAFAHSFIRLVVLRAVSGLGEAFYFPAALSLLAQVHGPDTRSRALSLHQSGVYVGTVAGGGLAAWVAQQHGWHRSFTVFGAGGLLLAALLAALLREPSRAQLPQGSAASATNEGLRSLAQNRYAQMLVLIFIGANFVASCFLTWLPTFLFQRWHLSVSSAGLQATLYLQVSSVVGVLIGGLLADRFVKRASGGRMRTQALGLLAGVPFLLAVGWASTFDVLVVALLGIGLCKGIYDSNIWASLYDTVSARERGVAAGLMNSLGWIGGGLAPLYIAARVPQVGMGNALSSTGLLYGLLGICMFLLASRFSSRLNPR